MNLIVKFSDTEHINQIDPHLSKELCDKLVKDDLIYGCGKSFQLTEKNDTKICDYI